MADDKGFLGRWARRKQAQKDQAVAAEVAKPPVPTADAEGPPKAAAKEAEPVDLASLPPIDSLGADSDYTAFLRPGVPQSMQLAALRRLWLTEPSVRNYEALVDYAWDFNAPGYGKLLPTDDVEKLLKAVFGEPKAEPGTEAPPQPHVSEPPKIAGQNDAVRRSGPAPVTAPLLPSPDTASLAKTDDTMSVEAAKPELARRRHGAALPRSPDDPQEG